MYAESYYPRDSFGWHELRGLLTSRFAYINTPRQELYDLQKDPGERVNLASTHEPLTATLRERLLEVERRYAGKAPSAAAPADTETVQRLRSLGYVSLQSSTATQSDPHRADPKDEIATLRRILRAWDLRRLGKYPEAEDLLTTLEETEPSLYVVPFERGENFLAWAKPEQALPEFGKALSLNPAFDQALLGLGRAHFMLGQDQPAAASLELALRLNPRNFLARLALAKVYWRQNLPAKAEPELAQVVKEHPKLPEGQADYAVILAKLGRISGGPAALPPSTRRGIPRSGILQLPGDYLRRVGRAGQGPRRLPAGRGVEPRLRRGLSEPRLAVAKAEPAGRSPPILPKDLPAQRYAVPTVRGAVFPMIERMTRSGAFAIQI